MTDMTQTEPEVPEPEVNDLLCVATFRCDRFEGSPFHHHDPNIEAGIEDRHDPYMSCHPFQPNESPVPTPSPLLALCPVCGAAVMARLRTSWQRLVESGEVIPIVGCGNPWHYAGMG